MNLQALLQLLRGDMLSDASDRVAGGEDFLWSDATLVTYINEAQRRFAVKGLVLRDGTTDEVTKVALVPGQTEYVLHPAIVAVVSARRDDQDMDLQRTGHSVLGNYRAPSDSWITPATFTTLSPGAPVAYLTDETLSAVDGETLSQVTLRVYPKPTADMAGKFLRLRVVRKPLEALSLDYPLRCPELPEDHHIEMLDWAAYLALRKADNDAGNQKLAADYAATFTAHVTAARNLAMRKLFAPVGPSFGRGGFTWER